MTIQVTYAQQNILNIVSNGDGFTIHFSLPEYELRDTSLVEGFNTQEVFKYFFINEFGSINDIGYPQLPQLTFDLPVAFRASDFQVTLSNTVIEEINVNRRILPVQGDLRNVEEQPDLQLNQAYYLSNGSLYNFRWKLSEPYVVFGEKGIAMSIFPFTYNPQNNKVQVLKQASLTFTYQLNGQPAPLAPAVVSETRETYLSNFFGNNSSSIGNNMPLYKVQGNGTSQIKGRYLMITAPDLEATLNPFADYKRNLGYEVTIVTTTITGTTAESIKNYIQNAYKETTTRPDFVLLVGDHGQLPASEGNV